MLRKILLVDDEPLNISLLREMLGRNTYEYLEAGDGFSCLAIASEGMTDLIILDWQMPHMDGLEALKELKSKENTRNIPVLMVTGVMNSPENLVTAMEEGAVDFLRKPFDRLELQARIRNMLLLADSLKEVKEKLAIIEEKNRFIQSLFSGVPTPLVYYDRSGFILHCNHSFIDHITAKFAESENPNPVGTNIYRFFISGVSVDFLKSDQELIEKGEGLQYEGFISDREYLFFKDPIKDLNGNIKGIICSMTDITLIRKYHNEMMEGKRRELVSSALRMIQINEINNQLIGWFSKLQAHLDPEGNEIARQVINSHNIGSNETIWRDFENRFENVYESFYTKLHEQFPDLTPGERKLCALLRLNISSKDIAVITLQNPQSVDMARYRLRKKLDLSSEDNLVDFLLKIG
ncbi:MAG TPA: response regulator [Bacteroidales bacterium]|nr:response regulator [Bacteroidales bacterium]HRZ49497.1 response regulator [Bacteroidales bacterium]